MDKTSLVIGGVLLFGSAYSIFSLATKPFLTSTLTAAILFAFLGLAFIRKAKNN